MLPRREPVPEVVEDAPIEASPSGKGRPTPKRREAAPKRGPVSAPRTRKEASQRQRQVAKEARTNPAKKMSSAQYREALKRGDPSVLPRKDQGPVRKLARDWVDSRRMASNYLLLLFPLILASYVVRATIINALVLVVFVGFLVEWYITGRRIRALAIQRFGQVKTGPMSIGFYAGSRAYLPRKFRVPAPMVGMGDKI